MTDNVEVRITGDGGDAKSSMEATARSIDASLQGMRTALENFGSKNKEVVNQAIQNNANLSRSFFELKGSVTGGFNAIAGVVARVRGVMTGMAAVLAGGALWKEAIGSSVQLESEVRKLETVFGMASDEATKYAIAIKLSGRSTDDFAAMAFKVGRMLKTQGEEFDRLGVKTKDANGNFLPMIDILKNAYERMQDFKAGTDQDMFAMAAAGRSAADFADMMRGLSAATERATQLQREMGIEMGPERSAQVRAYKLELNAFKVVLEAIGDKIGEKVMPGLKGLAGYLNETGPAAAEIFILAVRGVLSVLGIFGAVLKTVGTLISDSFQNAVGAVDLLGRAVRAVANRDWAGLAQVARDSARRVVQSQKDAASEVIAIWKKTHDELGKLWTEKPIGKDVGAGPLKSGKLDFPVKPKSGAGGPTQVEVWRQELEQIKDEQGLFNEFNKGQEAEFWAAKLALVAKGSKEYIEVYHLMHEAQRADAHSQLADAMATFQLEIDQAKNNKEQQISVAQARTATIKAIYGEESKEYKKALDEELKVRQAWVAKEEEVVKIQTKSNEDHFTQVMEMAKLGAEQQVALGQITNAQLIAMETDFENKMYASKLAELEKERALHADDIKFVAEMNAKILALQDAHEQAMTKLANQAVLDREQYALQANKAVEGSLSTLLSDLANGVKKPKQAFLDFFKSISDGLSKIAANQVAQQWLGAGSHGGSAVSGIMSKIFGGGSALAGAGGKAADTAAETAHAAAVTADTTVVTLQSTATTVANTMLEGLSTALATATAALASFSAGLAAGGAGGSAGGIGSLFTSFGAPSFDLGTPYVPQNMVAMVHKGEAIIPAGMNKPGAMGHTFVSHNSFLLSGPVDSRTLDQIAAAQARGIRRASRNT